MAEISELKEPTPGPSESDRPQTLGDLRTGIHLGFAGWLVIAGVLVAAIAFFVLLGLLGVDNS
ncbi:MAG: hypothetical protein ACREN7_10180 [Candidatus Dormibacteria bacterium]